jgi:hypothetical protein
MRVADSPVPIGALAPRTACYFFNRTDGKHVVQELLQYFSDKRGGLDLAVEKSTAPWVDRGVIALPTVVIGTAIGQAAR